MPFKIEFFTHDLKPVNAVQMLYGNIRTLYYHSLAKALEFEVNGKWDKDQYKIKITSFDFEDDPLPDFDPFDNV